MKKQFLSANPTLPLPCIYISKNVKLPIRINFKEYIMLDGTKKILTDKVVDGSIIKRFDKTPFPAKQT